MRNRKFLFIALFPLLLLLLMKFHHRRSHAAEPSYSEPKEIATITDGTLAEISGMTAARTGRGYWWMHNDSGDSARLYVVDAKGALRGKYTVRGARNRDWEDMASGPGRDGKPALYIGDIGDNGRVRNDLTLYRIKEPDLSRGTLNGETEAAEAFPFKYPDGRHDAEALIVDPKTGRPYLVTKTMSPPCAVYRFPMPLKANERVTLEKVQGKAVEQISRLMLATGAAVSPDGRRVVIRTYFTALELIRPVNGEFESIFNTTPTTLRIAAERQGEAICYSRDGAAIFTTSEKVPAPIYEMKRLP